jgi:hypothetical protein
MILHSAFLSMQHEACPLPLCRQRDQTIAALLIHYVLCLISPSAVSIDVNIPSPLIVSRVIGVMMYIWRDVWSDIEKILFVYVNIT